MLILYCVMQLNNYQLLTGCDNRLTLNYFIAVGNIQFMIRDEKPLHKPQAGLRKTLYGIEIFRKLVSTNPSYPVRTKVFRFMVRLH